MVIKSDFEIQIPLFCFGLARNSKIEWSKRCELCAELYLSFQLRVLLSLSRIKHHNYSLISFHVTYRSVKVMKNKTNNGLAFSGESHRSRNLIGMLYWLDSCTHLLQWNATTTTTKIHLRAVMSKCTQRINILFT